MNISLPESPLQTLRHPLLKHHNVTLSVKRDDLLHPIISGNKWRKLKYNLIEAHNQQHTHLLSFGGPFSNHLHALAAAGRIFGFETTAIIRGPELDSDNPTIRFLRACGMKCHAVDRQTYRLRNSPEYLSQLNKQFESAFIIPEGGSNLFAIDGVAELARSLPQFSHLITPVGSAGTLAGLIEGAQQDQHVLGLAVLNQADYLIETIKTLSPKANEQSNWRLFTEFHDGGYGRFSPELWQFCQQMRRDYCLPLEPIYSGKLFYGLFQLIEQGYFKSGSELCAIHTGGLQGLAGLRYCKRI